MLLSQCVAVYSQHQTTIDAKLNAEANTIDIQHEITYKNKSENSLSELYFTDWVSSYSSPTTPLVKKFLNEFNTNLYIAKKNKRGFTTIHSKSFIKISIRTQYICYAKNELQHKNSK